MTKYLQTGQSEAADRRWLSTLISAMDEASRPDIRELPCERHVLAEVETRLSRPACSYRYRPTFTCRN